MHGKMYRYGKLRNNLTFLEIHAAAVEQHREAQGQNLCPGFVVRQQWRHLAQRAALGEDQARELRLLFFGKSGHVRVLDDVGGMLVEAAMRDGKADLVQARGPGQALQGGLQIERLVRLPAGATGRCRAARHARPAPDRRDSGA